MVLTDFSYHMFSFSVVSDTKPVNRPKMADMLHFLVTTGLGD